MTSAADVPPRTPVPGYQANVKSRLASAPGSVIMAVWSVASSRTSHAGSAAKRVKRDPVAALAVHRM